jgi:energy-coupling factor transport system permease protein
MSLAIPDKLAFVLLCWTCAFLLPWEVNVVVILLLVLGGTLFPPLKPVSEAGRKYLNRFLLYSIPLVTVLIVANGLLLHEGPVLLQFSFFNFYEGGIQYALTVSVRLILLSVSILLFFVSTRVRDIVNYFDTVGLPNSLVSILLLTLFFLEQVPRRISNVFTAQEARGAPVREGIFSRSKAFFVILSPLILSSIVESVERGVALELRGYHVHRKREQLNEQTGEIKRWGYIFLLLTIVVITIEIVHWLSK